MGCRYGLQVLDVFGSPRDSAVNDNLYSVKLLLFSLTQLRRIYKLKSFSRLFRLRFSVQIFWSPEIEGHTK
jgi:hypothetical protein